MTLLKSIANQIDKKEEVKTYQYLNILNIQNNNNKNYTICCFEDQKSSRMLIRMEFELINQISIQIKTNDVGNTDWETYITINGVIEGQEVVKQFIISVITFLTLLSKVLIKEPIDSNLHHVWKVFKKITIGKKYYIQNKFNFNIKDILRELGFRFNSGELCYSFK